MVSKEVKRLKGILAEFFSGKFRGLSISPINDENGYHIVFRGVSYSMNFNYDNQFNFLLEAELPDGKECLEKKLKENLLSNQRLEKESRYLAEQKIEASGSAINASCRLKKIPNKEDETTFKNELWGYFIQRVMKAVYD